MSRLEMGLLSSTLLLPIALFLALTGLLSDFLDLNEFVYHKYAGYITAGIGLLHIYAYWPQLAGCWKRKLSRRLPARRPISAVSDGQKEEQKHTLPAQDMPSGQSPHQMSRREFLKLVASGAAGVLLGWMLRPLHPDTAPAEQDMGLLYHRWSTPRYTDALSGVTDWGRQPPLYKDYAWAERIPLPSAAPSSAMPLAEAAARRRSLRDYANRSCTLPEMSWLLHCASGLTAPEAGLRSAPSAGALYPIETYLIVHRVEELTPGLYHYAPAEHALERLNSQDLRAAIVQAGLGQEFLGQASLVFVLTAVFQRLRWRYRQRSYRYALLEAGHIAQNIYLAAEAAGMGACAVGAYFDDQVNRLLEVDGEREAALYLLAVGPRG